METGNLPAISLIKCGNIYTLKKSIIIKKIGKVNSATIAMVLKELHSSTVIDNLTN